MTLRCCKMAASVQMFPSTGIIIKKNAHPSSFYSKRSSSYVQEAREKLSATTNNIQKNYPVLISVSTGNNTFNFQKLKKNSNALSYEAPDLDKKMITGNLPKSFFGETGKSSETRKTEIKKKTLNVAVGGVLRENITEIERKLRDLGIQIAPCILEVRHRRKQHTENVAERAQKSRNSQVEVIGWKEALEMRRSSRGKSECLDKMDGQQILPRGSIKRQCNNLSFTRQIMS